LKRIVSQICESWPNEKIILRGDSDFCREGIMTWCEENKVEFVLGLAKNERLKKMIKEGLVYAELMYNGEFKFKEHHINKWLL